MLAPDEKMRLRDTLDTKGILRLIESVPSPNAEPFKLWLAQMGKESLRDNMTDIEVLLTDLGEIATRDIAQSEHPQGFNENMNVAKRGGEVANNARKSYEKQTKKLAISKNNSLDYKYVNDKKLMEGK